MRGTKRTIAIALGAVAVASGCQDVGDVRAFLQEPRSPVAAAEYRVYPPDVISISSQQVVEVNGVTQQIRPDGKINLPLLGEIPVAGLTPKEIEKAVKEAAGQYYEPEFIDITVDVVGYNSQKIYVFGQVSRPGALPWTGRDTLLDVLAMVQPTDYAWPQRIKVVRAEGPRHPERPNVGGYEPIPEEKRKDAEERFKAEGKNAAGARELMVDLAAMSQKGDLSRNILLKPGDVIYVPTNPFAKVGLAVQQVLFPAREVLDVLSIYAATRADLEYVTDKNRR